jgi:tetratricopeptide (TPR) repeat protein
VEQPLDEADLQDLLASYRQQLQNTHLLFPATGLRCLAYLRSFSPHGMLLLSADKGELDIARLQGAPAPEPERHGSISLQVNFHALAEWCRQQGGLALLPGGPAEHVGVCALVLLASDARHTELKMAYRRFVDEFGPDDFFAITLHARDTFPRMDFGDLLAVLRLARGDSHQLARFMPRLHELAPELTPCERRELCRHFDQVWANYFPLGEEMDLANHIAYLLYNIGEFAQSRRYYRYSCERYGESANSLFNLALCERACGAILAAHSLIEQVLALEPGHAGALDLLAGMGQHRIRLTGK